MVFFPFYYFIFDKFNDEYSNSRRGFSFRSKPNPAITYVPAFLACRNILKRLLLLEILNATRCAVVVFYCRERGSVINGVYVNKNL